MSSQVVSIKIDPTLKKQAQETAKDLGVPLSVVIKGFLKQFVRTKTVILSATPQPSEFLLSVIKQSKQNRQQGKSSPVFSTQKEAINYLEKNGI